jgi:hypothetical protein
VFLKAKPIGLISSQPAVFFIYSTSKNNIQVTVILFFKNMVVNIIFIQIYL